MTEEFEIEKIVSKRRLGETDWQYRIRWTGYGKEDDFWKSAQSRRTSMDVFVCNKLHQMKPYIALHCIAVIHSFNVNGRDQVHRN